MKSPTTEAHNLLTEAKTLFLQGNYEMAIPSFQRLVNGANPCSESFRGLGFALQAVGKPAEALRVFEKGLITFREDAELHFGRAIVLQSMGQSLKAIQAFEDVLKANPQHKTAHKFLQTALAQHTRELMAQGNFIWAEEMIHRQLAYDPKCPDALALSVEFDLKMAKYDEAKRSYRILAESKPDHPAVRDLAARLGLGDQRERGWLY